jgi:hypothetical protein
MMWLFEFGTEWSFLCAPVIVRDYGEQANIRQVTLPAVISGTGFDIDP